ncbi:hypothetical protein ACFQ23_06250 [Schaalia naturae]|jgi:hypothetical protein|uniref:Uncharacterized protein n=1 Tax=Schaalia naturae TaxID=635203 RepID=A0ABW2SQD8_9ACTO
MKDPILAVGDGALGFWRALPESQHPSAKKTLADIWDAEDKDHARAAGVAMAFKLTQGAQSYWRRITAPELISLVRTDVEFKKGTLLKGSDQNTHDAAHPVDLEPGDQQRAA